ncbi:MAG: SEC-C metal-binding domain-containing protein [Thermoplasmata archaeon]
MSRKLGRNDPCPCGSGKKYKKCCLRIGTHPSPHRLLDIAAGWILGQPDLEEEFECVLSEYSDGDALTEMGVSNILDAFIFDHGLPDGRTPFSRYLHQAQLSPEDRSALRELEDSVFSIFEVLEIYQGQGIKMRDLVSNRDHFVSERKGTYHVNVGSVILCRIAKFGPRHIILTPAPAVFPPQAGYVIKRQLRYVRSKLKKERMSAFDVMSVLRRRKERPRTLDEIKKALKKKLNSLGIRVDFRGLSGRINRSKSLEEAFPEVFEFDFPSNRDFEDTVDLLRLLWNKYPRKELGRRPPEEVYPVGPREKLLVSVLLQEVVKNVRPDDYSSQEEAVVAVKRFQDTWLRTPQEELDGRCPMDVILKEREGMGNPRKDFHYSVQLIAHRDYDLNKAERMYMEGVRAFKEGALIKAAELFVEVKDMYPDNFRAWGNLGICLAYMGDKEGAIDCLERSLSLNPSYECAKRGLEFVKGRTEETLARIGMLGAMAFLIHRHAERKDEEIDVWKDIEEMMSKPRMD